MLEAEIQSYKDRILETSGVNPKKCMVCGKCSATCPNYDAMEYHPHQFVQMVENGEIEPLLKSKSIYACLSCFACLCFVELHVIVCLMWSCQTRRVAASSLFASVSHADARSSASDPLSPSCACRGGRVFRGLLVEHRQGLQTMLGMWQADAPG